MKHSRHWRRRVDDGICWLTFDKADSSVNTLSQETLDELEQELAALLEPNVRGLVIESGKSSGFIVGADVKEFARLENAAQGSAIAARGQALLARIAALGVPSVAAIDGFALGGGLELALACTYRVAAEGYERTLGLPEVQLGIHPGFGGTVRAVQLLGAPLALDLMLTGRSLSPKEALGAGLVDAVVPRTQLAAAAASFIARRPARRRAPMHLRLLSAAPLRPILARSVSNRLRKRAAREHYPAPYAIVALWLRYGGRGAAAFRAEAESIGALLVTPTSRNLVRVFELRERLRNLAPKQGGFRRVHVVGAGTMGGDIAAWCALRGLTVTLQDQNAERLAPAMKRAAKLFKDRLRDPRRARDARDRLVPDVAGDGVARADVIIEAIFENVEAKRSVFASLEKKARPDAILASNTSSIPLEEIATALADPSRLIGLHFFNPVARMMLVEIVVGRDTREALVPQAAAFVRQIDKLPLPVKSAPGFLVNRLLAPYLMAAMHAVDEGVAPETIDEAAVAFGMPMGPIELADTVGLDICVEVGKLLGGEAAPPKRLMQLVEAKQLGKKTGRGFYEWVDGKPKKNAAGTVPSGLADRLVAPYVSEAKSALAEHIVADADLVDAGAVFGTGFAPFRGGPLHYAGVAA
jgi:3-hydroxyacyl-CoA dehydrogenase/enoyl-CoA hydratase/3-hydroxybutyryl-CoA epimerase